ncbi:S-adenosyl-L-methionine-dependent methyltransferase [Mortierella sp. GBAus27b]|nr:S-adenosyl-L-methionine-dependent methyltransferase [Mortierella sp. GBAus27b]
MSDIQSINNEYFNKTAEDYDNRPQVMEICQQASDIIVQEFTNSTSDEHVRKAIILDFGCGTGISAFQIASKVERVVGIDASEGMLRHLNHKLTSREENAPIRDKVKTIHHLVTHDAPLPEQEAAEYLAGSNGGFDMIYSTFVMHHIEDVQGIINTLVDKLLKKDGWLVVVDFEGDLGHHHHHHGGDHHHAHGEQHHAHGDHQHAQGDHHHHAHGDHQHAQGDHHHHAHGDHQHAQGDHHHHAHGDHQHAQGDHHHHAHGDHQHAQGDHHAHGDHHQHQGDHGDGHHGKDIRSHFVDKDGKPFEHVAHMEGFTPKALSDMFEKAGLVDVSAKHAFFMDREMHGKPMRSDVALVKGRRP